MALKDIVRDLYDEVFSRGDVLEDSKDSPTWKFYGVYSNNFQDKTSKVNILSAESHRRFEEALDTGEVETPALRYWHIEADLGRVNDIAYDERGFTVVHGEFYPEFSEMAQALSEYEKPLGMSHRVLVTPNKTEPNVADKYVSSEVSFLPVEKAASPLTMFEVFQGERHVED